MNNRYGIVSTMAEEPCQESLGMLKRRIKMEKRKLKDFMELSEHLDMNYEQKNSVVGSTYTHIKRMQSDLKRRKQREKKKGKK